MQGNRDRIVTPPQLKEVSSRRRGAIQPETIEWINDYLEENSVESGEELTSKKIVEQVYEPGELFEGTQMAEQEKSTMKNKLGNYFSLLGELGIGSYDRRGGEGGIGVYTPPEDYKLSEINQEISNLWEKID